MLFQDKKWSLKLSLPSGAPGLHVLLDYFGIFRLTTLTLTPLIVLGINFKSVIGALWGYTCTLEITLALLNCYQIHFPKITLTLTLLLVFEIQMQSRRPQVRELQTRPNSHLPARVAPKDQNKHVQIRAPTPLSVSSKQEQTYTNSHPLVGDTSAEDLLAAGGANLGRFGARWPRVECPRGDGNWAARQGQNLSRGIFFIPRQADEGISPETPLLEPP